MQNKINFLMKYCKTPRQLKNYGFLAEASMSAASIFAARADLVTGMKEIRHYYQKDLKVRTGIKK